jgi:hypothetical protein
MSYLSRIESKLDELVRAKKSEQAEKEPTQEEKDEERLREIEERMSDLTDLLSEGVTRESADARVGEHRDRVKSGKGEPRPLLKVFHDHGGKRIATTRRTQVTPGAGASALLFTEVAAVVCVWFWHNASMPDARMNLIFIVFVVPHVFLVLASWLALHLLTFAWVYVLKRVLRVAAE